MKKRQSMGGVFGLVSLLFILGSSSTGGAESESILSKLHPYITVQEEYNNNILLTNRNKIDDFITTVRPGLKVSALSEKNYGIDSDFSAGYVFYAKQHDFNYFSPSGRLDAFYAVSPTVTFRLRDYLIRSDEVAEPSYSGNVQPEQFLLSTIRGQHAIYLRNVVEPSAQYQFAENGTVSVLYRNNVYHNQNPLFMNSQENTINPKLTYWFDVKNGIVLDYSFTYGQFEHSPDLTSNGARAQYTYRFSPMTSIFGTYFYQRVDFESPGTGYDVQNPSLGIEYKFSPTVTGTAQGGYFWQTPDQGTGARGPFFNFSLAKTTEKTTYSLSFQGGYTEDYFTAQNLGFAKYYRAYGRISHRMAEKLTIGLTGSMERPTYSSGQKDWIWRTSGNVSYQLLTWLSLFLQLYHTEDHSNFENLNYSDYRAIVGATARF